MLIVGRTWAWQVGHYPLQNHATDGLRRNGCMVLQRVMTGSTRLKLCLVQLLPSKHIALLQRHRQSGRQDRPGDFIVAVDRLTLVTDISPG
jgi:hypothetical protein